MVKDRLSAQDRYRDGYWLGGTKRQNREPFGGPAVSIVAVK